MHLHVHLHVCKNTIYYNILRLNVTSLDGQLISFEHFAIADPIPILSFIST